MTLGKYASVALAIAIGGASGAILSLFPVPLPYLLGALLVNAAGIYVLPARWTSGVRIPESVRLPFIAIIGLLIGARAHVEMVHNWTEVNALLAMVTVFTPLAFVLNYMIFRHLVRYDHPTALFASAPGGLIEAIELGTRAGANPSILMMQQFLRIVIVVTLVPLLMSLWEGHPVGSAAGLQSASPTAPTTHPLLVVAIGVAGIAFGRLTRLPAGPLTGPLVLAALLSSTGWMQISMPSWLIIVSQIVIGTALGLRFNGIGAATLRRGVVFGLVSVSAMLMLGGILSLILMTLLDFSGAAIFLSFAPGGVTEMALVALSMAADPAVVTLAHVYRIILTVLILSGLLTRLRRPPSPPE